MEKKDIVYLFIALLVVLAFALVGKPLLMGEESPLVKYLPVNRSEEQGVSSPITPITTFPPISTPPPTTTQPYRSYAILNGTSTGKTESFTVPFSTWVLSISAIPKMNTTDNSSFIFPRLRIQVVDTENPSRIVQSIEPDLLDARINTPFDPRPWKVEIPEGNRTYYLVVYSQSVESYTIEILVQG